MLIIHEKVKLWISHITESVVVRIINPPDCLFHFDYWKISHFLPVNQMPQRFSFWFQLSCLFHLFFDLYSQDTNILALEYSVLTISPNLHYAIFCLSSWKVSIFLTLHCVWILFPSLVLSPSLPAVTLLLDVQPHFKPI